MITYDELMEYQATNGRAAAVNLLLLAGPDGFDGDYKAAMIDLGEEEECNQENPDKEPVPECPQPQEPETAQSQPQEPCTEN